MPICWRAANKRTCKFVAWLAGPHPSSASGGSHLQPPPISSHIRYCLKFVQLLLSHRIRPILVFDGRHLPAKAGTELKRRE